MAIFFLFGTLAVGVAQAGSVLSSIHEIPTLIEQSSGKPQPALRSLLDRVSITPGVEANMNAILEQITEDLENNVESKIRHDHLSTQQMILDDVNQVQTATTAVVSSKHTADEKDQTWQTCVGEELEALQAAEAQASLLPALLVALEEARLKPPAVEDVEINPNLSTFECDFSEDATGASDLLSYKAQISALEADVDSKVSIAVGRWQTLIDEYHAAQIAHFEAHQKADMLRKEWRDKHFSCLNLHTVRMTSMCSFGMFLQEKCRAVGDYNTLIAAVDQVGGNEYSHPDRVEEWRVTHTTKCLITLLAEGKVVDSAALTRCDETVDYDRDVGTIDKQTATMHQLTTPAQFSCNEQAITFAGGSWEVPAGDTADITSDGYKKIQHQTYAVNLDEDSDAFLFCGDGDN